MLGKIDIKGDITNNTFESDSRFATILLCNTHVQLSLFMLIFSQVF